ncbi:ABC-2 type transport system permease protein [Desulfotomaculum arcticum]|uniref:Transport permease protein n=1 Tax=Desulfotruncus arcticus DSM 17038 TaxID=1121424 RepID=A0A1I2U1S9_9FIRM|nr:ABC transporter permease [Desulfotruncus arcticus]SFG71102.1 ABC-2 type transport system permease protein [Desulfotomaculum arcticum] [Desulfotruncus arcticus DSM 17038]
MSRILAVLHKEFLQMRRDRMTLGLVFMLPLVQLLLFGYAIQTEVRHISTVVFDQSLTAESRDLLEAFSASGYYDINYVAGSYDEVSRMIDSGRAKVGIIIPPDFSRSVKRGEAAQAQVIVDASDNMVANQAVAIATSIGLIKSQEILTKLKHIGGQPYDIRVRPWYNPDGITAYYMVPAILGIIVTMTMVIMTSMGIVRERERGTLEQLIVTPVKAYELMIGKILPYIALGYVQITVALLVGVIVFGVPIRGSLLELYLLTLFFITASLGVGIFISNIAKTQMQAFQMSFFFLLPSILLSGFMFPRDAMPKVIYLISNLIPLTYYLDIIRGIVLKGIGFQYLVGQVASLLVFSVVLLFLSVIKFKKKVA